MLVYKMDVDNKIYLYNYNNKNSSIVYDNKSDIYINYRIKYLQLKINGVFFFFLIWRVEKAVCFDQKERKKEKAV